MDDLLALLRAAGEPTRLRILSILSTGEMTVSEMTQAFCRASHAFRGISNCWPMPGWSCGFPKEAGCFTGSMKPMKTMLWSTS